MDYMHYGYGMGMGLSSLGPIFLIVMAWSFLWKGLALWRSAKRGDMWWFVAFLFLNTLGILELIYIFAITGGKISDFTSKATHGGHHGHTH